MNSHGREGRELDPESVELLRRIRVQTENLQEQVETWKKTKRILPGGWQFNIGITGILVVLATASLAALFLRLSSNEILITAFALLSILIGFSSNILLRRTQRDADRFEALLEGVTRVRVHLENLAPEEMDSQSLEEYEQILSKLSAQLSDLRRSLGGPLSAPGER